MNEQSLTVVAPVLNEVDYIKAWCENVTKFASEVLVIDMGSTDGTRDILHDYHVKVLVRPQRNEPYTGSEAKIRNELHEKANTQWIMRLDADELIDLWNIGYLKKRMEETKKHFIWLKNNHFWLDKRFLRARRYDQGKDGLRFQEYAPRVYRNIPEIKWKDRSSEIWLPVVSYKRYGILSPRLFGTWLDKPAIFHYHYVHQKRYHGPRTHEIGKSDIRCVTYLGPHPEEVKYYKWWNK